MTNQEKWEKKMISDITEILKEESIPQDVRDKLDEYILQYGRLAYEEGCEDGYIKGTEAFHGYI